MQQPYLLPGALPSPKRRTNLAPVFVAVFLGAFLGAGYLIWQKLATTRSDGTPAPQIEKVQAAPVPVTDPLMEDLSVHFQNAIRSTIRSSELVRQSQRRIRAVMPAMDRNYLSLERTRLEAANALAEEAIREANRASEELEVAQKLTQQKLTEGGKQ